MSMVLVDPLTPSARGDSPAHGRGRRRWAVWRSPYGQPPWAQPVLLGIAAVAALLYAWNITEAGLAPFYSVAVKSMSESWKAFFYGAFDPKATITIDKLAVSLSWIALYTFTPARDRPYVDGSTNNSAAAMVFGYNGLERFGITITGAVASGPGVTSAGGRSGGATGRSGPVPGTAPGETGTVPGGTGANSGRTGTAPGGAVPGGTGAAPGGQAGAGQAPGGVRAASASAFGQGWTKLLGSSYGPEIGWLYPLAVLALIFGLLWTLRSRRTDQVRAGFVMWGVWLLTVGLIFSEMSTIPHTAYMASLAPPLAALSAAGIVMFGRYYRAGDPRGWLLPVAVAAELAWGAFLWRDYGGFLPWMRTAAVAAGAAAVVVMVAAKLTRHARARLATAGLTVGVVAALAAPSAWAASVLDSTYGGSSFNASAGPAGGMSGGGAQPGAGRALASGQGRPEFAERYGLGAGSYGRRASGRGTASPGGFAAGRGAVGGMLGATTTLSASEQKLYDYVNAHRDGASYLMAMSSWSEASPFILSTGQEVMPLGGFSGSVPEPTLARVRELVSSGQLRFFLLNGSGSGAGFSGGGSTAQTIASWVRSTCRTVPAGNYEGSTATASAGGTAGTLYVCGASS